MTKNVIKLFTFLAILTNLTSAKAGSAEDLVKAIQENNVEGIKQAIASGADVNGADATGAYPIGYAIFSPEATQILIEAKANVNVAAKTGQTALMNAANWGQVEVVKLLIAAGADVKASCPVGSVLSFSLLSSKLSIVKLLVEKGANLKETVPTTGLPLFIFMLQQYKSPKEKIENIAANKPMWEKYGAKIPQSYLNSVEADFTPSGEVVQYFFDQGAAGDINKTYEYTAMGQKRKSTALSAAFESNKSDAVKYLLEKGASVKFDFKFKATDNNPKSPYPQTVYKDADVLLASVLMGKNEMVKLALEQNKDLLLTEYEAKGRWEGCGDYVVTGINLLMLSAEQGNPELTKILIDAGGKWKDTKVTADFTALTKASWNSPGAQKEGHNPKVTCNVNDILFNKNLFPAELNVVGFAKKSGNNEVVELLKSKKYKEDK